MQQNTKNILNSFDEHGLLLDLQRLRGEPNKTYKQRLLDVGVNRTNASYNGLLNGITRELGLTQYEAITISLKIAATPAYPAIVVDQARLLLYDDYVNDSIDAEIELYDHNESNGAYSLNDVVTSIDASTNFEAVLVDSSKGEERGITLIHDDNHLEIPNETMPVSNAFFLSNSSIVKETISFSESDIFLNEVTETDLSLMNEGEYNIDYSDGKVIVKSKPSGNGSVYYNYIELPFNLKANPVILKDFNDDEFKKRMFVQEYNYEGTSNNGMPKPEAIDIIVEAMKLKGLYWGE